MDQPWDAQQPMPGPQPAMPDSRQLLAQMLMQQAPAAHERFDNPESLKLQMLAPTFGPGMPDSTRGALAEGTLPPIINACCPSWMLQFRRMMWWGVGAMSQAELARFRSRLHPSKMM
mgnify:CR=1 FL=1